VELMKSVSVVIPVYNEATYLPGCLKSVAFAEEIIVVDSDSTDETRQLALDFGAVVVNAKENSIVAKKNEAGQKAKSEWVLFLDADERVSPALRKEILALDPQEKTLFDIPRLNYILGKPLKHGGWYPDLQGRLVKRSAFLHWEGKLHEQLLVTTSEKGQLRGDIIHFTHRGLDWMLEKSQRYARIEAELRFEHKHPKIKSRHLFTAPLREFWQRGVLKQGYKDGIEGWIEIIYQSFNAFLIMVYLWQLQNKPLEERYDQWRERIDSEL
jgi:glycosyltransferase involved in cell wall biosynthesis